MAVYSNMTFENLIHMDAASDTFINCIFRNIKVLTGSPSMQGGAMYSTRAAGTLTTSNAPTTIADSSIGYCVFNNQVIVTNLKAITVSAVGSNSSFTDCVITDRLTIRNSTLTRCRIPVLQCYNGNGSFDGITLNSCEVNILAVDSISNMTINGTMLGSLQLTGNVSNLIVDSTSSVNMLGTMVYPSSFNVTTYTNCSIPLRFYNGYTPQGMLPTAKCKNTTFDRFAPLDRQLTGTEFIDTSLTDGVINVIAPPGRYTTFPTLAGTVKDSTIEGVGGLKINASVHGSSFSYTTFDPSATSLRVGSGCSFMGCNLAVLSNFEAYVPGWNPNPSFTNINFMDAALTNMGFSSGSSKIFNSCDFRGADLTGTFLAGSKFINCRLEGACFAGTDTDGGPTFINCTGTASNDPATPHLNYMPAYAGPSVYWSDLGTPLTVNDNAVVAIVLPVGTTTLHFSSERNTSFYTYTAINREGWNFGNAQYHSAYPGIGGQASMQVITVQTKCVLYMIMDAGHVTITAAAGTLAVTDAYASSVGAGSATMAWGGVCGSTSYNIYYETNASVASTNSTKLTGVSSPHAISGLPHGAHTAAFVTAVSPSGESPAGNLVVVTP